MLLQEKHYTIEDLRAFEALPENAEKLFELIDGVMIEKMTASLIPSAIAIQIATLLKIHLMSNPLGHVTGADGSYKMTPYNEFIPDVAFISKARLPELLPHPSPIPPDLAVEVVSPSDSLTDVHHKAMRYIELGTPLVWIVYPERQAVDVYRPAAEGGAHVMSLSIEDTLDGGNVLTCFTLPVKDIFYF